MGGRPLKPTALKLIEGEKNKDRINKSEPKPRPVSPQPPATLDKYGRAEWKRMASIYERLGLLTEIDGAAFAAYCALYSQSVHISKALKACKYKVLAEKHTVDGAGNEHLEVKINPLITAQRQVLAQMLPYIREFGGSPSSRGRISVPGGGGPGEFENLLD